MATSSIFHNVVIEAKEAAERLLNALERAEKCTIGRLEKKEPQPDMFKKVIKKVMREVEVFDVGKLIVGTKIKYISNDERDEYYDCVNKETIYDWGYGEVLSINEDMVVFDYYSEIVKVYKQTSVTPDMILNDGYVLEVD